MQAYYQELLPPTGAEHALSINLSPSALASSSSSQVITNLVTARANYLWIYQVRVEPAALPSLVDDERRHAREGKAGKKEGRRGTEAVEGEVEMDAQGDGFVNLGAVKSSTDYQTSTVTRLRLIRTHRLHGIITGLCRIQTLSSAEDGLERLAVSFKDAKISIMEWSETTHDLTTVSIHSYERSPFLQSPQTHMHTPLLRADPLSRCIALLLPHDALAVMGVYQANPGFAVDDLGLKDEENEMKLELDVEGGKASLAQEVPYSPSFILPLPSISNDTNPIQNVVDFVFLSGFNNPTLAVLWQGVRTWTGRLNEHRDTTSLSIITLSSLSPPPASQTQTHYPIISSTSHLPYDALSIIPVPQPTGGVLVLCANSIVHVDSASGRKVGWGANGWGARVGEGFGKQEKEKDPEMKLEGAHVIFPSSTNEKALLITSEGLYYPLSLVLSGRAVSAIVVESCAGRGVIPSCVEGLGGKEGSGVVFVGSTVGMGAVLNVGWHAEDVEDAHLNGVKTEEVNGTKDVLVKDAEMDLDDDIYGTSSPTLAAPTESNVNATPVKTKMHLTLTDTLPGYGGIHGMAFCLGKNGDKPVAELVAATGVGHMGSLTFFQHQLPTRTMRKFHAIGGSRGIWHVPLLQPLKSSSHPGVIVSTDIGVSRVAARSLKNDVVITNRSNGTIVGAGPFFQGTAIVQVTSNSVRLLEPDGKQRQEIPDSEGSTGVIRPKIRACSIADPYVVFIREDDTLGLFIDAQNGKLRRKDMSAMGDKSSRYVAGTFFTDQGGVFRTSVNAAYQPPKGHKSKSSAKEVVTSSLDSVTDANRGTQWLLLCRPQGIVEIWSLPKLSLAFSTTAIPATPSVLVDSYESAALSPPEEMPRQAGETDVEELVVTRLGESDDLYMIVLLRGGYLLIYEVVPVSVPSEIPPNRELVLPIQFFKLKSYTLSADSDEDQMMERRFEGGAIIKKGLAIRQIRPFTSTVDGSPFFGAFLTGDQPLWILSSNKGGVQIHHCQQNVVNAFTACPAWEPEGVGAGSRGPQFLLHTDEGPTVIEWIPEYTYTSPLPTRQLAQGNSHTHVQYDSVSELLVAAAAVPSRFRLFDEEGHAMWEPDSPDVAEPIQHCSAIELISPDDGYVLDGFEFAWNEFVNSLEMVNLETLSTETGEREFIACGTSIFRGEDLAVKGATYIFEIVEVVPTDPEWVPETNGVDGEEIAELEQIEAGRHFRLKLLCRDESKGPVTAVASINGYLVNSMGQKIFVRAFDLDERLVGVAFLDVGVYVTTLTTLKNLLLIGDARKSLQLVAFQEDPFKLRVISRDTRTLSTSSANFVYAGGEMGLVTRDDEGIVRLWAYEPYSDTTREGEHLMISSEFNSQNDAQTCISVIHRDAGADLEQGGSDGNPVLKLLWGCTDGSMSALVPISPQLQHYNQEMDGMEEEPAPLGFERYKRLHLLQGRLLRGVMHTAGLNPRSFRAVPSPDMTSSRGLRGILDGALLRAFFEMGLDRQAEMCKEIGSSREVVVEDLHVFSQYQAW